MLRNEVYVEEHKDIYAKQSHVEAERDTTYNLYEKTQIKYEESKILFNKIQGEKRALEVKLLSIEKENEVYNKQFKITNDISQELAKCTTSIHSKYFLKYIF